ncbi:MAG: hypothetical protein OXI46_07520 [Gemmatimonadota bacterium]|nr:hypothetical protein [Gemmatimonadota bacterium]
MAIANTSYNPGFLTEDELRAMFCVRVGEFESLLETLRENTGQSNQHVVVVGPRGSGKTTLLLRVALEVGSDPELSSRLYPIVFAEESYSVSTCGEFWLECLSRLAQHVPRRPGEPDLQRTVEDVRKERDDRALRERCLGALLHFAEREKKRLVLHVENLNMLFSEMMDPDAEWCLRKTLQTEPRVMIVGSATSRFEEIDRPDRPLYDLFRVLALRPLDRQESAVLCERESGTALDEGVVRRLQILTGGSPRLLAIVARFAAARSFRTLMSDLLDLVDEHTAYFKSHLESLPAHERRVYLALAGLWKPAMAREVAEQARMETSACSAQLRRLMGRGVVSDAGGTNRRKQYYVSERLYNIYYLLRRSRGTDSLVRALVRFMDAYYSAAELREIVDEMVAELGDVDARTRLIYQAALERFSSLPELAWHFCREYPHHVPDDVKAITKEARALMERGLAEFDNRDLPGALVVLEDLLRKFRTHPAPPVQFCVVIALVSVGSILMLLDREEDAILAIDEAVERFEATDSQELDSLVAIALFGRARMLDEMGRAEDALVAYDDLQNRLGPSETVDVQVLVANGQVNKAETLIRLQRLDEALEACEGISVRFGNHASPHLLQPAWRAATITIMVLSMQGRTREHLSACQELLNRLDQHDERVLAGGVADHDAETALTVRLTTRAIRAITRIENGNLADATADVREILGTIPRLSAIPVGTIQTLIAASLALGVDRMASLIRESPSASHLLPLTTALDWEMRKKPRVAAEVRKVAKDIQREFVEAREQLSNKGRTRVEVN